MALKARMGEQFNVFGRGIRPINDKSEAMDDFRYHIAVENHIAPGFWTEKIADCFLAYCVPFYYGPEDVAGLFPKGSVIPIDIYDIDGAEAIIREEIKPGSYEARLPAITQAREQILERHNLMTYIARKAAKLYNPALKASGKGTIMGRHKFRQSHPIRAAQDIAHRARFNHIR